MSRITSRSAIFYALTGLVVIILVTKAQQHVLPGGVATQVGHNSEAFLFALLVSAQIQILRRVPRGSFRLAGIGLGAVLLFVLGTLLLHSDLAPTLVTLNEPLIGAGFVLLYLGLPRSHATAVSVTVAVVLFVTIFFDTGFVLDQAESLVPLALAGPALDVFDRTILQPELEDAPGLRLLWMALLLVAAIGLIFAAHWARQDLHGGLRLGIDYLQRAAEAYWGWLLVHAFFSYWLGSMWRSPAADPARELRQPARG